MEVMEDDLMFCSGYVLFFFACTVEDHMRANTQNAPQGEQETRRAGEGMKKLGNRDLRFVEWRGV